MDAKNLAILFLKIWRNLKTSKMIGMPIVLCTKSLQWPLLGNCNSFQALVLLVKDGEIGQGHFQDCFDLLGRTQWSKAWQETHISHPNLATCYCSTTVTQLKPMWMSFRLGPGRYWFEPPTLPWCSLGNIGLAINSHPNLLQRDVVRYNLSCFGPPL